MIANARMYAVNAAAAEAWDALLRWVISCAGVAYDVVAWPPPQPLPALWARADLGCAFMCGYPLSKADPAPTVLAAPIPSPPPYRGEAVYWTNFVARKDGPVRTLEDAFGKRMAFTTPDSQSGYQAPRELFAQQGRAPLFAATVGPLVTPRRVIEAVLAGDADVGPVDSYAFDLVLHHEPEWVAPLAVVATTARTPIPPLVGAPTLAAQDARRLTDALLAVGEARELADVRAALLLRGFAPATGTDYAVLRQAAQAADDRGYPRLI
jgi:ABC-type phosphate/phosphonate transport system substrate-binding protein